MCTSILSIYCLLLLLRLNSLQMMLVKLQFMQRLDDSELRCLCQVNFKGILNIIHNDRAIFFIPNTCTASSDPSL